MMKIFYYGLTLVFLNGILIMIIRRKNPFYFLIGMLISLSSLSLLFFQTSRILGNPDGEIYAILIFSFTGFFTAIFLSTVIRYFRY